MVLIAAEPTDELKSDPRVATAPVTFLSNAAAIYQQYDVDAIPHTFYFDRGGQVALETEGYSSTDFSLLEKRVASELGGSAAATYPAAQLARR